jgi:hypothetical protein
MAGNKGKGDGGMKVLTAVAAAAPLLVVIAMFGAQFGVLDKTFAFDVLAMTVARYLALAGVAAAALAVVQALQDMRRRGLFAVAAVVLAGVTLTVFLMQQVRLGTGAPTDVSSDLAEPPGFSRVIDSRRAEAGAVPLGRPGACVAAVTLPTQVAPETASAALKSAGFTVIGTAAFRAEGVHQGFWFGFTHDAVIRIRPGQTDVRVTAREGVTQGDEACRLAAAVVEALKTAS